MEADVNNGITFIMPHRERNSIGVHVAPPILFICCPN